MSYAEEDAERLLHSIDLTALGAQNFRPDGTYSFAGVNWTSENQAASTAFENQSSVGLKMDIPSGGSFFANNTRTAPLLRCALTDLTGPLDFARMRCLHWKARVLLSNVNEDAEFAKVGIEWATTPQQFHFLPGRGWPTPSPEGIGVQNQLSAGATSTHGTTTLSSNDVIEGYWNLGEWAQEMRSSLWTTEMPWTNTYQSSACAGLGSTVINASDLRLVISAQPTFSATSFIATLTHLDIFEVF